MYYEKIIKGDFIERPNRFVAEVLIGNKVEKVHVKNTGRCQELLIPGTTVFLEDCCEKMEGRKLRYSLIGVMKGSRIINMDSQAPNKVVREALLGGRRMLPKMGDLQVIKGEQTFGNSRFDFYVEDDKGRKAYVEVKGVTLEESGVAKFPDAPTERGIKHLTELEKATRSGYEAYVIFVVQMEGVRVFEPNDRTHPAFGETLRKVCRKQVVPLAYGCRVKENSLKIHEKISIANVL